MGRLRIQCFGRFQVWRDKSSQHIQSWGRRKTQQLLKLLIQERGRVFSQDVLVDILFPDGDPQKSIQNLHGRISELRKALEPDLKSGNASRFVISASKGLYYFTESDSCIVDTEEFERLVESGDRLLELRDWHQAVKIYSTALSYAKAEYLQEDRYEDWTTPRRNELNNLTIHALEGMSTSYSCQNNFEKAIRCCEKIHELDPNHEPAFRQRMLLHHRLGEKAEAIEAYQRCVQQLNEQLNVKPARETDLLYQRIVNNGILIEEQGMNSISIIPPNSRQNADDAISSKAEILYKRGSYFLSKQSGLDAIKAKSCFEEAIACNRSHAPSYEGLASSYFQLAWFHIAPAQEVYPKAKEAVSKALMIDDQLADAYVSRGYMKMNYEWDGESAYQDLLAALELNPDHALAYRCIAGLHAVRANFPSAIENIERAYALDPVSFSILIPRAWMFYLAGQFERAIEACEEILEMEPSLPRARSLLGLSLEQLKEYDKALIELRRALKLSKGNLIQVCDLAHLYARIGERQRAESLITHSRNPGQPRSSSNDYYRAVVYAGLSQEDRAVASLRTSWNARSWKAIFARTDPRFKRLDKYDPYQKLHEEIWSY